MVLDIIVLTSEVEMIRDERHWEKLIEADAEERDKIVQDMIKAIREYIAVMNTSQ